MATGSKDTQNLLQIEQLVIVILLLELQRLKLIMKTVYKKVRMKYMNISAYLFSSFVSLNNILF